jgi:myosin heavy subunit
LFPHTHVLTFKGFPIHVPAEKFVEKYHSLATLMRQKLSTDPKQAVAEIMRFIKAPDTEWQIGKTKVCCCVSPLMSLGVSP